MTVRLTDLEFKLLRDLIYEQSGIFLTDNKAYLVEARLANLLEKSRSSSFGEFYLKVKNPAQSGALCNQMVDAITTNETSWFRDQHPYQVLKKKLLPELETQISAGQRKRISIWSAACSSGQEPYSLAMTILDFYGAKNNDSACHNWVNILATDISTSSLAMAAEGRYDAVSMNRGLQQDQLERYFKKKDQVWIVEDRVKKMVSFRPYNLKSPTLGNQTFDIIFLRNVMIYFPDSLKRELFDHMASHLAPGGYLFLGTGETSSGYTSRFEMLEFERAIYYRVRPAGVNGGNGKVL